MPRHDCDASAAAGHTIHRSALSVTDANSLTTAYVRNGFGAIIRTASPDTGVTDLVRDERGLVTQKTDARGKVAQYQYDNLGRLTNEIYPATPSENIAYGYDSTANGNKGVGRLTSITDPTGSTTFKYDVFGNMISTARVIAGKTYTTSYAYDKAGKITSVTHPSGRVVNYLYNIVGAPKQIRTKPNATASYVNVFSSIAWKPIGNVGSAGMGGDYGLWNIASGVYGNNLKLTVSRDLDGRPSVLDTAPTSGGASVHQLGFSYDPAGNIVSIADGVTPARSQTFQYDSLNRLTQAVGVYGTIDYSYDLVGSRTAKLWDNGTSTYGESYAYAAGTNRLASISAAGATTRTLAYEASGQLNGDQKNGTTYVNVYDDAGRLIEARNGTTPFANYSYDAFEQRASKTTTAAAPGGAASIHFIHDVFGRLIAEHDGATGAVLREYVWLGLLPVAYIDWSSGSAVTYYVDTDQVMVPRKLTDAAKAVVFDRVAEPFGVEISATGALTQFLRSPVNITTPKPASRRTGTATTIPSSAATSSLIPSGSWAGSILTRMSAGIR